MVVAVVVVVAAAAAAAVGVGVGVGVDVAVEWVEVGAEGSLQPAPFYESRVRVYGLGFRGG